MSIYLEQSHRKCFDSPFFQVSWPIWWLFSNHQAFFNYKLVKKMNNKKIKNHKPGRSDWIFCFWIVFELWYLAYVFLASFATKINT